MSKRTLQTSSLVAHFLRLSFLFLVVTSSVHAFSSCHSLQRKNFISKHYHFASKSSLRYASTPFDVGNNNDQLWQLMEELIRRKLHNNNNNNNKVGNNDPSRDEFHRVIQSLYCESQLNIHNLEKEIEILRQRLETSPHCTADGRSGTSFQETLQDVAQTDTDHYYTNDTNYSVDEVDEISNKLLKAVFVGYQWTEEDKKRLSSAHPRDYSR